MRRPMKFLLVLAVIGSGPAFAQSKLPNTPVREVTDDYFGTKVTDPYRWLEKTSAPEVAAWMKAQNDYTRAVLAKIPGRDQLLDRIKALDNAGSVVSGLQVWAAATSTSRPSPAQTIASFTRGRTSPRESDCS